MNAIFELSGDWLSLKGDHDGGERQLRDDDVAKLKDWSRRYRYLRGDANPLALQELGREMFSWLNSTQKWLETLLATPAGEFLFEFRCAGAFDDTARAFLNAPWEVLADNAGFLAKRERRLFCVSRRLGKLSAKAGSAPNHGDVAALFMASAPEGAIELDYEAEEVAILTATQHLKPKLNLAVEDSGALAPLAARVKLEGNLDIVHLSCHGDDRQGTLIFEDEYGNADAVTANRLKQAAFGDQLPPLIFLSACHSAEDGAQKPKDAADPALPLSLSLIQAGFPSVLGWGGPVLDRDATRFARELYGQLVKGCSLERAAAYARLVVLKKDDCFGRDWHLARLYLGSDGGAALCAAGAKPRRKTIRADHGHQEILQTKQEAGGEACQQLPVASRQSFVGRRRETQEILRVFWEGKEAGVLIHGQGRRGKTSLAAHVANRLPALKPVVIFRDYRATTIFREILKACPPALRPALESQWSPLIEERDANLGLALEAMLAGPLSRDAPILLIIDDLEQALDEPKAGQEPTTVKQPYLESLRSVVEAFAATLGQTDSRLLFTSRFTFTLPDAKNRDLAKRLHALALPPMNEREQKKQMQARLRLDLSELSDELQARCIMIASGNPGLQELLTSAALEDEDAAKHALAALEGYLADGAVPKEEKTAAFLENLALTTLLNAVDEDGRALLRAGTVLSIPVPESVFAAMAKAFGLGDVKKLIARLSGLGLLDRYIVDRETGETHFLVNRLVRPALLKEVKSEPAQEPACPIVSGFDPGPVALTQAEQTQIVNAVLPILKAEWSGNDGRIELRPEALELMRFAELVEDLPLLGEAAAAGAIYLQRTYQPQEAARVAFWALEQLETKEAHPPTLLLQIGAELAGQFGHGEIARNLLESGLTASDGGFDQAALWLAWAERQAQSGNPDEALTWLEKAKAEFERLGEVRERAVTMGQIADILYRRGDLDEALRIRREEELPVYERLGDVRSRAVTMGQIADILYRRGDLDEALRIRREEQLPVYERLGEVRERAVTMGQIADILYRRGDLDEALRIRREEELPVYERLGDVRSRAVTMGQIADILFARGDLDEALRIRREEELPVYERLGDVRSRAVTMGYIADILFARGDLDEALRIRREEQLPVFERLGDVLERAVTMGQIADILFARGDLDEALRIRREEQLPVFERLGEVRERAVTMGQIADILFARGDLDEALRIRREEQLPVFERLGEVRERAVTMGKIADILYRRGDLDEALRIRREEQLPVYERLGEVRERAVTMGQIADILFARGDLDEALRIRREEQLPVYERLGEVRERVVTMGQIADILFARGDLDEALRIRREEELPVYERLGDVRSRAVTMGYIADILFARGDLDEALRIRREEELPVYERLGDVRSRAVTMGQIADILFARGDLDEALRIRREEQLPVFERLGDKDGLIHVKWSIACGLLQKGISSQEDANAIFKLLAEAYRLAKELTRLDAICAVALDLGQLLASAGAKDDARPLLIEARDGRMRLGQLEDAAHIDALIKQLDA